MYVERTQTWRTVMVDDEPIRQQLNAGEHLLWSGRPRQGIRATFEEQAAGLLVASSRLWGSGCSWLAISILGNLRDVEGQFDPGALIGGLGILMVGGTMLAFVLATMRWTERIRSTGSRTSASSRSRASAAPPSGATRSSTCSAWTCRCGMMAVAPLPSKTSPTRIGIPRSSRPSRRSTTCRSVYDLIHRAKEQAHGQGPMVEWP